MNRLMTTGIALCLATGCGTFVPVSGNYEMSDIELTENGCLLDDEPSEQEGESFRLDVDEDELTAKVVIATSFDFDCELDGKELLCDDLHLDNQREGYNLMQDFFFEATFLDESSLDGGYGVVMSCEGEKCAELLEDEEVTLPCTSKFSFHGATGLSN